MGARNRFQGMNSSSLCSLAGRYDNPLPPRFLAPIDSLKIQALASAPVKFSLRRIPWAGTEGFYARELLINLPGFNIRLAIRCSRLL
jgi:hypothetical protein